MVIGLVKSGNNYHMVQFNVNTEHLQKVLETRKVIKVMKSLGF